MKTQITAILMSVMLVTVSCNNSDCKNANPVFEKTSFDTKEYQDALAKILESPDSASIVFTLERYEEKDGIPQLHMNARSENLCATAVILVLNPDENFKTVQKVKGEGYEGAEFRNLKYKIFRDEAKTVLLYEGVESIVD